MALIDHTDPYHSLCDDLSSEFVDELFLTSWPCFTEAMYLLGRSRGFDRQQLLWRMFEKTTLNLWSPTEEDALRMPRLMQLYQDQPMDLADASLVAAAEATGLRTLFTLDKHFQI